mmetsp:Transcript_56312/g.132105  ORF Transcript_56312/g.132105 Transcript_56312/m.132105 type:complete len:356 (+) Transcript_56312:1169-2236(+)
MADAQGVHPPLIVCEEVAVTHDDELSVTSATEDVRDRLNEQIAALLRRMPTHEEEHGIHTAEPFVGFCVPDPLVLPLHVGDGRSVNAVVDHRHAIPVSTTHATHLVLEDPRHADQLVGGTAGTPLEIFDAWVSLAHVAIPAALRGVHREDDAFALALQLHDAGSCHPVVAVHDVEATPDRLMAVQSMDKGAAHVACVLDEATCRVVADLVVMNTQDLVVLRVALRTGEDVHLVPCSVQGAGQLRDVGSDSTHSNGVKGLPREHRDLQRLPGHGAVLGVLHSCHEGLALARQAGAGEALHKFLHRPLLIAFLQESFPKTCEAVLTKIEAQTPVRDGSADTREERRIVSDHGGTGLE